MPVFYASMCTDWHAGPRFAGHLRAQQALPGEHAQRRRVTGEPESGHRIDQLRSFVLEAAGGGSNFFHHGGVLLGGLVHVRNGLTHLLHSVVGR
jgi:hypothetical protein